LIYLSKFQFVFQEQSKGFPGVIGQVPNTVAQFYALRNHLIHQQIVQTKSRPSLKNALVQPFQLYAQAASECICLVTPDQEVAHYLL
jgi:hypothetical protein